MNILDEIVSVKEKEVLAAKERYDNKWYELNEERLQRKCVSLKSAFDDSSNTGIIAEFKRKSPSKGWFKPDGFQVGPVVNSYAANGAVAASILTDEQFFGGNLRDLSSARSVVNIPLLRKDFIIDEIQIAEAKAFGADIILLIAAILTPVKVQALAIEAKKYGLEVLLEIHNEAELECICGEVDLVGVNNRNLKTFEVSIQTSLDLINKIPTGKIAISESGISDIETIRILKKSGFKGFLIGENFMKQPDPTIAFADFIDQLKATT